MLNFLEAGGYDGLFAFIIIIFLIIGILAFLISLLAVYLYFKITGKNYTRKELWGYTVLLSLTIYVISGMVCGFI